MGSMFCGISVPLSDQTKDPNMFRRIFCAALCFCMYLSSQAQSEEGLAAFVAQFKDLPEDFQLDGEELGENPEKILEKLDSREVQMYLFPEFRGISRVSFYKIGKLELEGKYFALIYLTLEENKLMRDCRAKLAIFDENQENIREVLFARRKESGPELKVTVGSINPDFTVLRHFYTYQRNREGKWKLYSMSNKRLEIPEIRRIPPDRSFGGFKVSGFQYYGNELEDGVAALLYHYGRFVDTIDWYSPQRIGTGLAYIRVRNCGKAWTADSTACGVADGYWFHNSKRKVPFQEFLRGYDSYFSSPQIQAGKIWYYELYHSEDGMADSKVWFSWYHIASNKRMRVYLGGFAFGTDYRYILEPANFQGNRIVVKAFDQQWTLDRSLRILERPEK